MTTDESKPVLSALHYAESDKLGPLGAKLSALYEPAHLRKTLIREFNESVTRAREAAGSVEQSATTAVHDVRKALRRARAVLAMITPALPKNEARAVRRALRDARRSLSTARDHAVAPETFASLTLSDEDRATGRRVLDNAAAALPPVAELKQLLSDSAARAAAQVDALEAALPQEIAWSDVVKGVRDTYDEGRDAHSRSKKSKQWFHTWRRRSKELVYQLDTLADHAGQRVSAIRDEISAVVDWQSPAVDLVMLREFVSAYDQGIPNNAIGHLKETIDNQLEDLMKQARVAGMEAFDAKARRFGKRLAKAAKRDLTPPDDADSTNDIGD